MCDICDSFCDKIIEIIGGNFGLFDSAQNLIFVKEENEKIGWKFLWLNECVCVCVELSLIFFYWMKMKMTNMKFCG